MATYTNNLNLEKPDKTEQYSIDVFNANADKIDNFAGLTPPNALTADKLTTGANINGVLFDGSNDVISGLGLYSATQTYNSTNIVYDYINFELKLFKSKKDKNIGNPLSSTEFWEEVSLGGSGHNLFDVVLKDKVLTFAESSGFAQLGSYVYKEAVVGSRYGYSTFYEQCLKEYQEAVANGIYFKHENGHVFYDIANKAEVDAVYNSTGIAWAYGIDTANERIFLPRNDYYFKNGNTDEVGSTVNQELPNIKGELTSRSLGCTESLTATGVFTGTHQNDPALHSADDTERYSLRVMFNASKSNSIYKDGGEVIPKSVSMIAYMVVGNTANEEALTDIIDITTTENDTLSLFYNTYSQQDMTSTGAFVNASLGNYLDGNVWTTAYAEIEKMGIGAKFGAGTIKTYGDSTITDFDLVLNQSNMTFRLPLLNGSEDLPSDRYEELLLPASDTEYTAPANGWYYVYKEALTANEYLTLQNKTSGKAEIIYAQEAYNQCRVSIDAKKGDIVNIGYSLTSTTTKACRFIYAQGNGNLYYKLGNVVQNAQLLDVAAVTSALSKKVSADNLVETPVIIETYNITASNGYIVWSNGWCEQWGRGTAPSTANSWGTTITLNKKYVNKAYGITLTNWGGSTQGAALKWNSDNLTESTFQVLATVSGTSFNWRTWGVLAEGEY